MEHDMENMTKIPLIGQGETADKIFIENAQKLGIQIKIERYNSGKIYVFGDKAESTANDNYNT